jgi:hypothetical protein
MAGKDVEGIGVWVLYGRRTLMADKFSSATKFSNRVNRKQVGCSREEEFLQPVCVEKLWTQIIKTVS